MSRCRSAALLLLAAIAIPVPSAKAQDLTEPDKKQQEAFQKIQALLDERLVEAKAFQKEMPLAKVLQTIEQQLPKDKKVSLLIDKDAFGAKSAEVSATPVSLPPSPSPQKTTLRKVLEIAFAKIKTKADYRIGAKEIAITTPQRALYTAGYDIREIVTKPVVLALWRRESEATKEYVNLRDVDRPARAGQVVKAMLAVLEDEKTSAAEHEAIQILNGTRLLIHSNPARHAQFATVLDAFHRLADVAVTAKVQLYEVDEAFYTKLKTIKRVPLDEEEQQFLAGKTSEFEKLFALLPKQKLVQTGDPIKVDSGLGAALLSRQHVVTCLPTPDQVKREQKKERQTIIEGVSFLAGIEVSPDRRTVRMKLTEKSTELLEILKVEWQEGQIGDVLPRPEPKKMVGEIPVVKEATQTQQVEIPDGGWTAVPVHYRPKAIQERNRWWVLMINARIIIEEEERLEKQGLIPRIPR